MLDKVIDLVLSVLPMWIMILYEERSVNFDALRGKGTNDENDGGDIGQQQQS